MFKSRAPKVFTPEQRARILELRRGGARITRIARDGQVRARNDRVMAFLGEESDRLRADGRGDEADTLYKRSKRTKKATSDRHTNIKTPLRVKYLESEVKTQKDPERLVELLKTPTAQELKVLRVDSLKQFIADIRGGEVRGLTYRQAAILLGCNEDQLAKANRLRERGGSGLSLKFVSVNGRRMIDARDLMRRIYPLQQGVIDHTVFTNVLRMRYGLSPQITHSHKDRMVVENALSMPGMSKSDFLKVLERYDRMLGLKEDKQRVLSCWTPNYASGRFDSVTLGTIRNGIEGSVKAGMFLLADRNLIRTDSSNEFGKRESMRCPGGRYRVTKSGRLPKAIRDQNKAALAFLGVPNEAHVETMTPQDRKILGNAIAALSKRGEFPLDLPKRGKDERTRAYLNISEALFGDKHATPIVREIATRLSEASAGLLGREVLRERVAGMLTASDLPLLNAYREFPDVYPGLYARLMGRRNGRKLRLYDAMPGAKEELRYPLFSHLVTQKARGVSGGFDRAHMDHAFRRYVRSQARGLGIDPGYVLGLTGVPMDGCKVPKGVNPWEYLRLTRVRQQEAARKSVEEAVRGMMLRNGRQSP